MAQKLSQLDNLAIPGHMDYDRIPALSNEATQKFKKIRPATLGQASRISGVNPSDVQILLVYMGR
jgi:tRNA uridine 5-carboxymethylaminomethyl modification enzyme